MNMLTKGLVFAAGVLGYAALGVLGSAAHAATPGIPLTETACIVVAAQALTDYGDRGPTLTAFLPTFVGERPGCAVELTARDGSFIYANGTIRGAESSQFETVRREWAKPPVPGAAKKPKAKAAAKASPKGQVVATPGKLH
jgi:hypothetical protein